MSARSPQPEGHPQEEAAATSKDQGGETCDLSNCDLSAYEEALKDLDFTSDFAPFLTAGIPDEIRKRALAKLWICSPLIAQPDELDDYLEDFSEAAMGAAPDALKTAYAIGQGFWAQESTAALPQCGEPENGDQEPVEMNGTPHKTGA